MNIFSDRFFLITAAIIASTLAWSFWSSLQQNAFPILSALALITLIVENRKLRKELKTIKSKI